MTSFVDLDDLKVYCEIDPEESKYNSLLTMLSNQATSAIQGWLKRDIFETQYCEKHDIRNNYQLSLQLDNYPIIAIQGATNYATELTTDDYILYEDIGIIKLVSTFWEIGNQYAKVTYTAGYVTIPDCLVDATCQSVREKFNKRNHGNLKTFSGGGVSYEVNQKISGLDPDIAASIAHLRKI